MTARPFLVHATALAVAVDADGPLAGALLFGASGAGKTAAALAAIESCPWRRSALVADDATLVAAGAQGLVATAPETIRGLAELRGYGPVRVRTVQSARLIAGFDLDRAGERLPVPERRLLAPEMPLPVWPAPAGDGPGWRLRLVLRAIVGGQTY